MRQDSALTCFLVVVIVATVSCRGSHARQHLRTDVVYSERNHKEGRYKYGYAVKKGETQFHHQRSLDGAMYGCYGYVDPEGRLFITHYLADMAGYRLVNMASPDRKLEDRVKSLGTAENPVDLQSIFPRECQQDGDIKTLQETAEEMRASKLSSRSSHDSQLTNNYEATKAQQTVATAAKFDTTAKPSVSSTTGTANTQQATQSKGSVASTSENAKTSSAIEMMRLETLKTAESSSDVIQSGIRRSSAAFVDNAKISVQNSQTYRRPVEPKFVVKTVTRDPTIKSFGEKEHAKAASETTDNQGDAVKLSEKISEKSKMEKEIGVSTEYQQVVDDGSVKHSVEGIQLENNQEDKTVTGLEEEEPKDKLRAETMQSESSQQTESEQRVDTSNDQFVEVSDPSLSELITELESLVSFTTSIHRSEVSKTDESKITEHTSMQFVYGSNFKQFVTVLKSLEAFVEAKRDRLASYSTFEQKDESARFLVSECDFDRLVATLASLNSFFSGKQVDSATNYEYTNLRQQSGSDVKLNFVESTATVKLYRQSLVEEQSKIHEKIQKSQQYNHESELRSISSQNTQVESVVDKMSKFDSNIEQKQAVSSDEKTSGQKNFEESITKESQASSSSSSNTKTSHASFSSSSNTKTSQATSSSSMSYDAKILGQVSAVGSTKDRTVKSSNRITADNKIVVPASTNINQANVFRGNVKYLDYASTYDRFGRVHSNVKSGVVNDFVGRRQESLKTEQEIQVKQDLSSSTSSHHTGEDRESLIDASGAVKIADYVQKANKASSIKAVDPPLGITALLGNEKLVQENVEDNIEVDDSKIASISKMETSDIEVPMMVSEEPKALVPVDTMKDSVDTKVSQASAESMVKKTSDNKFVKQESSTVKKLNTKDSSTPIIRFVIPGIIQQGPPVPGRRNFVGLGNNHLNVDSDKKTALASNSQSRVGEIPADDNSQKIEAADVEEPIDDDKRMVAPKLPATPRTTTIGSLDTATVSYELPSGTDRVPVTPRPTTSIHPFTSAFFAQSSTAKLAEARSGTTIGPSGDIYDEIDEDVAPPERPTLMSPQILPPKPATAVSSGVSVVPSISSGVVVQQSISSPCYEVTLNVPLDAKQVFIQTNSPSFRVHGDGDPNNRIRLVKPGVYEVNLGSTSGIQFQQYQPQHQQSNKINLNVGKGFNYADLVPKPLYSRTQPVAGGADLARHNNPYLPLAPAAPVEARSSSSDFHSELLDSDQVLTADQRSLLSLVPSWKKVYYIAN